MIQHTLLKAIGKQIFLSVEKFIKIISNMAADIKIWLFIYIYLSLEKDIV
jgi:hypothetical protein